MSTLISVMKRQMDAAEERLRGEIQRGQQHSERHRHADIARFETRLAKSEGQGPKMEKKIAELAGAMKSLSDEMQGQIRHVNQVDNKLTDTRHDFERELHGRMTHAQQQTAKDAAASNEEALRRLDCQIHELAAALDEKLRHGCADLVTAGEITVLEARLDALEGRAGTIEAVAPVEAQEPSSPSPLERMQEVLEDVQRTSEIAQKEAHGAQFSIHAVEERLNATRTLAECTQETARADQLRVLACERRANDFETVVHELGKRISTVEDQLGALGQHEATLLTPLGEAQEGVEVTRRMGWSEQPRMQEEDDECSAVLAQAQRFWSEQRARLEAIEQHLGILTDRVDHVAPADSPSVSDLAASLEAVRPKVWEQEGVMRDMQQSIGQLTTRVGMTAKLAAASVDDASASDVSASRLAALEEKVDHLVRSYSEAFLGSRGAAGHEDRSGEGEVAPPSATAAQGGA